MQNKFKQPSSSLLLQYFILLIPPSARSKQFLAICGCCETGCHKDDRTAGREQQYGSGLVSVTLSQNISNDNKRNIISWQMIIFSLGRVFHVSSRASYRWRLVLHHHNAPNNNFLGGWNKIHSDVFMV